jgi:hypothetical protein
VNQLDPRLSTGRFLEPVTVGKVVGVELTGQLPPPQAFAERSGWAWFLAAPPNPAQADPTARNEALRLLYGDPHIASLAAAR